MRTGLQMFARSASESRYPQLWSGPVGAWCPSLGPTGATLRDWSGRAFHGTVPNPAIHWKISEGRYANFSDTSLSAEFGGTAGSPWHFGAADFGISLWVRASIVADYQVFVGKDNDTAGQRDWVLSVGGESAGKWNFVNFRGNPVISTSNAVANVWTHLAFIRKSGTLYLYVNRVLEHQVASTANFSGTGNVTFGRREGTLPQATICHIDDVRLGATPEQVPLMTRRGIAYEPRERRRVKVSGGRLLEIRRRACA